MNSGDLNKQFEALKRHATDLVRELHARKLAIPAAALLLAIVAAIFLLPKGSTPPPAPPTTATPAVKPSIERVAQVSLIKPASLDEQIALTGSTDPFTGDSGYSCKKISSNPDTYDCLVSDLVVRIECSATGGTGPCAADAGATGGGGASSSTGGSSGGSSGGSTGGTGGGNSGGGNSGGGNNNNSKKSSYYTVTVSIDGTTKKNVVAGDTLPKESAPLTVYAGTNDAHTKAVFIAADGVTVAGVVVDQTFGSFTLKPGQTATLTDTAGAAHKLTLKSISKVTK